MSHILKVAAVFFLLSLSSCALEQAPVTDPVTWYAANPSGSAMTIIVYDKICNRRFGNVRIAARSETPLTTCGDGTGKTEFRYRLSGYAPRSPGWIDREIRGSDQRLYVN